MKRFKIATCILSVVMLLTACDEISQKPLDGRKHDFSAENVEKIEETISYTEYVAEIPEIIPAEASMIIQAEECNLNGSLKVSDERKGYSGEGYVTGFKGGEADYLVISADIPVSQHYDVTICVASDEKVNNEVIINGSSIGSFNIEGNKEKFVKITFYGVYIEQGVALIQINHGDNEFDIDYIKIENNQSVYENEQEIEAVPVSEKSSYEARDVLRYLKENMGENIITGQFAEDSRNLEIKHIYKITGKYPVIRFGDIGGYATSKLPLESEIKASREWDERGGIVGLTWLWNSPSEDSDIYAKNTKFSLEEAMTKEDIAILGISELQELCRDGVISRECLAIVEDIDDVASGLNELAEDGIPVLWRPLPKAGEGLYWWGASGSKAYKWLYNLIFERMTIYHELDNLIWVWNGQSEEYLVDDDKYDIASIDIYDKPNTAFGSHSEKYQLLKMITENEKLIALSECSNVPGIDEMLRDRSVWSYFGLWYGKYLFENEEHLDEIYTRKDDLIKIYNAENSITLDEYSGIYGVQ